jgi:hypothetical protein
MRSSLRCVAPLLAWAVAACGSGEQPADAPAIPCNVDVVLVQVCQKCHSSPPADGVPISLVTYEDTQAPYSDATTYHDTPTWRVMRDLVQQGLMPQPPVTLDAADRTTLLQWLGQDAPPAPTGTKCP